MFNFLHTFEPQAILFSYGPITVYWYGLILVIAILAALAITFRLAKYYGIASDTVFDLSFWLIIGGIIGARVYDDLLQLPYYIAHPIQSLEVWKGGLAIHGAVIAGLLIIFWFARKSKINFWALSSLIVPGLALGQSVGRWGNYFNQEIFGLPTSLPWGIPIETINRPVAYIGHYYFHPTFFYESLGCLVIALFLIALNIWHIKRKTLNGRFYISAVTGYMVSYSILRFFLEFIRLDQTPTVAGLRFPQLACLAIIALSLPIYFIANFHARQKNT